PVTGGFVAGERFFCAGCARVFASEERRAHRKAGLGRALDATVCGRCGADGGEGDQRLFGRAPLCEACAEAAPSYPFPRWLVVTTAVLAALLVAALIRGLPLIAPARALVRAERYAGEQRWSEASDELAAVLAAAPESKAARWLKIKSDLLCDRFDG